MNLSRRLWLLLIFSAILLVVGCGQIEVPSEEVTSANDTAPTGITYVVQRGEVVHDLKFTGQVVPVEEIRFYFQTSGYVDQILIHPGQRVEAGDLLAKLGGALLQDQISAAELELSLAQARFDEAKSENAYRIAQAEVALKAAREEVSRTVTVDSHVAEIAVERAEVELEYLKEGVSPVFAVEVRQAELALARLKETVQIVAPVDGVIASVQAHPGQLAEPFETVLVMASSDDVEVSAFPSQDQLHDMFESQPAIVSRRNGADHTWQAQIRHLPYPYGTGYDATASSVLDNSTRISLVNATDGLNLGDVVLITIILERKDNVLWLPLEAIRTFQERPFVIAQVGGGQRRVDVELGVVGQDRVEIAKGLTEGQVVIATH